MNSEHELAGLRLCISFKFPQDADAADCTVKQDTTGHSEGNRPVEQLPLKKEGKCNPKGRLLACLAGEGAGEGVGTKRRSPGQSCESGMGWRWGWAEAPRCFRYEFLGDGRSR